ncbi:hypothetical protein C8R45DRAFT_923863 [Mycena sanguinolenta]|nr:hypothetical protein C8R45DRAFT_923863 [Mycena sanguinolenta]
MPFKALASIVALSAIISVNSAPNDICLKICAPQELSCADGWHSHKVRDNCNTCCKDQESPMKSTKVEAAASLCRNASLIGARSWLPALSSLVGAPYNLSRIALESAGRAVGFTAIAGQPLLRTPRYRCVKISKGNTGWQSSIGPNAQKDVSPLHVW